MKLVMRYVSWNIVEILWKVTNNTRTLYAEFANMVRSIELWKRDDNTEISIISDDMNRIMGKHMSPDYIHPTVMDYEGFNIFKEYITLMKKTRWQELKRMRVTLHDKMYIRRDGELVRKFEFCTFDFLMLLKSQIRTDYKFIFTGQQYGKIIEYTHEEMFTKIKEYIGFDRKYMIFNYHYLQYTIVDTDKYTASYMHDEKGYMLPIHDTRIETTSENDTFWLTDMSVDPVYDESKLIK